MPDIKVSLNKGGEYITIDPGSAAFRFGQGFFSTTLIYQGVPLWIEEHIERLNYSLKAFNLPVVDDIKMKTEALKWARLNQGQSNLMRLLVWPTKEGSSYHIFGEQISLNIKTISLTTASFRRHSSEIIYKYKSFNYWQNLLAYEEANKKGFGDAVILNEKEEVCETSRCNIFWIKENILFTPHLDCNLLNGIMRQKVLGMASDLDIEVREVKARFKELESAEAVFITNSVRGIIPVVQILQQEYKAEHELVKALVEKLKEEINNYINAPEKG